MRSVLGTVLLIAGLCACKGIGRSVVDRHRAPVMLEMECTRTPTACDAEERDVSLSAEVPLGAMRVPANACGAARPADCDDDADAGVALDGGASATACGGTARPLSTLGAGDISCEDLRIEVDSAGATNTLRDLSLTNTNLVIVSTQPFVLVIENGVFEHVFVRLEGPVTLRIADPVTFDAVSISGTAGTGGLPRLELHDLTGTHLAVGDADRAFPGTLLVQRARISFARVWAETIELDNLNSAQISLRATDANLADTVIDTARLDIGRAVISAGTLMRVHVDACGMLMLVATDFTYGELAACRDEPLRAYGSSIVDSTVDGTIDSDRSAWRQTRFGVHAPTDLVGWNANLQVVNFCSHARSARLGDTGNEVKCSTCAPDALAPEPLCGFRGATITSKANKCPQLPDALPMCQGARPVRPRTGE